MDAAFPDIKDGLERYQREQQQLAVKLFFKKIKALHIGRTYSLRLNANKEPEQHRPDGSPWTKPSRFSRTQVNRRRGKVARLARAANR